MDLKKLSPGEMVIGISGVVLLIFSFFKWYGIDIDLGPFGSNASFSRNGWQSPDSFWSFIAILIGIAMVAHVVIDKFTGVELPQKLGTLGMGLVYLIAGAVAFVFLLIKYLSNTDFVKFGFYVALAAGIGLVVGGFLTAKERGDLKAMQNRGGGTPPAA